MGKKKMRYNGTADKRLIEKNLSKGTIYEKDLKEYFTQLPDVSDNAEEVVISGQKTNKT
jgi:hypothetical protein